MTSPGADPAELQGDAPTAEVRAGLWRPGLTQTTPRVSRFEKCSPSLPLSLWARSPGPDGAALCLSRGSVLQSHCVTAAVTWLPLGEADHGGIWVGTKQRSPRSGAPPPECSRCVCMCVCTEDLLCDQQRLARCWCSIAAFGLELSPSASSVWEGGGCVRPQSFPGLLRGTWGENLPTSGLKSRNGSEGEV